jgi:CobQ-like glutamine amidotransferase family enzyme
VTNLRILSIFPSLLNVNGDAANALVLAQRARWAGHSARIDELKLGGQLSVVPDLVVIGSTADASLPEVASGLAGIRTELADWIEGGTPVLAVGSGMDLLGEDFAILTETVSALRIVPGGVPDAPLGRVADDLVVNSSFGRLVGFENHYRGFSTGEGVLPLGRVEYGVGNDRSTEGFVYRNAYGTHLHGPVLAKNPAFADHLLGLVIPGYDSRSVPAGRADDMAKAARNSIAARLSLVSE